MSHIIINTLKSLSKASEEALESLETHDYRHEAKKIKESQLPLQAMPKTIKQIFNSIMKHCIPIVDNPDNLPAEALLNAENMTTFSDNLNITGNKQIAKQFTFIKLEPIKDVADEFTELGLHCQARYLENIYNFGLAIRQGHNASPFCNPGIDMPKVSYVLQLAPEQLTTEENENNMLFTEFSSVFFKDSLTLAQKKELYTLLQNLIRDPNEKKPHLVVMTVILILRTKKSLRNPLPGQLSQYRNKIFHSLGLDPNKCKTYNDNSLKKDSNTTLYKYKPKAEEILQSALGITR
jgi:hypothetical protein